MSMRKREPGKTASIGDAAVSRQQAGKDGGELFVMGETMKKVESSGKLKGINPEDKFIV